MTRSHLLRAAAVLALLEVLPLAAIIALDPPAPAPASAPAAEFSAARAFAYVRELAREPHPAGSAANARVRAALVAHLAEFGLEVEVAVLEQYQIDDGTFPLANVLARRPGTASTGTVVLAAHYDSTRAGPGAADDMAAVAALLETVRALDRGPPLRNDLLLAITDGEELGLLGARAWITSSPPADVGVVLNFEARGNSGPSILFQTSPHNAGLIAAFAAHTGQPIGFSLAAAVYELMPNNTDFTVYRRAGWAGLNFAFLDGFAAYHTSLDRPELLSLHSLQHHGEYALGLARHFGSIDFAALRAASSGDAVFFPLPIAGLVHYPLVLHWPIAAAALLMLWLAHRRRRRARRLLAALTYATGAVLVIPSALAGGFAAACALAAAVGGAPWVLPAGESHTSAWLVLVVWNLCWAGVAALIVPAAGARLLWAALLIAVTLALPEAAYLLAWPLLAASAGALTRRPALAWLGAIPALVLLPMTIGPLMLALAARTPIAVGCGAVLATLGHALVQPLLPALDRRTQVALALAAAALWGGAALLLGEVRFGAPP